MLNAFSAARYTFFINGLVNIANTSLIDVYVVHTTNLQVLDAQEVEWIMCQVIPNMILIEITGSYKKHKKTKKTTRVIKMLKVHGE